MMNTLEISTEQTVAEVVKQDIRTAKVFRKYGIDFCCGGHKSIDAVCEAKNIDAASLRKDLERINAEANSGSINADSWELDFLASYIVNVHHKYVREHLPSLEAWSAKVAKVHGEHNPETIRIAGCISEISEELNSHMVKEEKVLFPAIVQLVGAKNGKVMPTLVKIEAPIQVMVHEHEAVGNLFKEIETLSNNFTPPEHACNTFRALYNLLQEFENDLFLHIHLENNILFPKAQKLRDQLEFE